MARFQLPKKRQAYRTAVGRELATLYSPIRDTLNPTPAPETPSPADTIGRLERIKRFLSLGEINRSQELIDELIDALKT